MTLTTNSRLAPWMPRLRWFVAELLVVTTGILIALALQAWWQGRGEVRAERAYLEQMLGDTRENELLLNQRIARDSLARIRSSAVASVNHNVESQGRWVELRTARMLYLPEQHARNLRRLRAPLAAYRQELETELASDF